MNELTDKPLAAQPDGIRLNQYAIFDLGRAAGWAKFIAVIGFILSAVVGIAAFCVSASITQNTASPLAVYTSGEGVIITVIYIAAALVSFIIYLFLYQFGNRTKAAIMLKDAELIARAIHKLQSFFKAIGIVIVVNLILTLLIVVYIFFIMGH
jgi:divalent metal cation (Fe/Co/Zn/Cd) transporter